MGTTFVTLVPSENGAGFWMKDEVLELWLRLLALHLPEPTDDGCHQATLPIRNRWLLASKGCFGGCVPHGMEEACSTPEGRAVVRTAIESLMTSLVYPATPLDPGTLKLLGFDYSWVPIGPVDRCRLRDVGQAFIDLLDGKITDGPASTRLMPGSKPYPGV